MSRKVPPDRPGRAYDDKPVNTEERRMSKSGIDQDALIDMFAQASAKQGEALRRAVSEATLKALQGRELTLDNIRKVLKTVTQAASAGGAQATSTVEQLMAQTQTALRDSRAMGLRATQALMDSYSALVSGVLIGMSEGLQKAGSPATAKAAPRKK